MSQDGSPAADHLAQSGEAGDQSLPILALLALAATGFIGIVNETLPAGLLPQLADGLGVSQALAGQTVTAYALGSLIAALPLTVATQGMRRRMLLLTALAGFLAFNTVTALSTRYELTLVARFLAGIAAGLSWSLLAGYARRMVPPHQQGKALAVAMVGTPIALSLGVPLGTMLGLAIGWRSAFGIMSLLTVFVIVWVLWRVPDFPGQSDGHRVSVLSVYRTPGVRPVLTVIIAWMLAHNILYTYITPFLSPAGLGEYVGTVLLIFGIAALVGILIIGLIVDGWLRIATLVSLAVFGLVAIILALAGTDPVAVCLSVGLWGLTFGGAATLLQTALADSAGAKSADVAQSMCVTVWNGAIAGGGILGGILLDGWGVVSFPWVVLVLTAAGLLVTAAAARAGFRPGSRDTSALAITAH